MTRCSTGRATQKYRGNGTDLSDILETPGDIIYADAAVSAENLVISGTTGDVLKVSASGIPEWGTSTSQWITSGDDISYSLGHVGIGTTSPDANLHVTGNAFVSTDLGLGGTLTMGNVLVEALHELSAITATGNVTPHTVEFQNATTGFVTTANIEVGKDLTVTGNVKSTHVSLGTPLNPTIGGNWVTIVNSTYDGDIGDEYPEPEGGILFTNRSSANRFPWGYYMGVVKDVASTTSTSIRFDIGKSSDLNTDEGTGGTDTLTPYLTIDNGNVGIGTVTPLQTLEVNGSIGINHNVVGGYTFHTNTGALRAGIHSLGGNHLLFKAGANNERMRLLASGELGIGTSTPGYTLDVAGDINFTGEIRKGGVIQSFGGGGSGSSPWVTSGNDISYTTGNVGIGTSSPDEILHLSSNDTNGAFLKVVGDTSNRAGIKLDEDAGDANIILEYDGNGSGAGNYFSIYSDVGGWIGKGGGFNYIPSNGRVGIGTNSPQGPLHVSSGTAGDCRLILQADTDNNDEGDNPRIEFWQDGAIQESAIGMTSNRLNLWNSVSSGGGIAFHTGTTDGYTNAIERMTITSAGNVGINQTSPNYTLDVAGDINFTGEIRRGGVIQSFGGGGSGSSPWVTSGNDISYTAGRVGVGTTSPDANLHVEGNVYMSSNLNVGPTVSATLAYQQQGKIQASDAQATDEFGYSVSISGDGNTAIIGAYQEDDTGFVYEAGAAYIFTRSGGTWTQQQKIQASDRQVGDRFGHSVSLSSDGNTAIIGAYREDTGGSEAGAAYVFTLSGGTWTQQQKIQASDIQAVDYFGYSVSLSSDGNTALIGAYREDTGGSNAGAAYIFTRSGGTWTQQQKIQASDKQADVRFGYSVSLSSDGNTAIIGAYQEDTGGNNAGAAYVFTLSGGTWTQQQKIQASDAQAYDEFGHSVSLSSDGNTAIIGAYQEDDTGFVYEAGAAYIFTRSSGTWTQQQKIQASDIQAGDYFGYSVSLSSDGNTALIGAYREDTVDTDAGAVYVFTLSGGTWTQQQKIQASDAQASDNFGYSVSLSSDGNTAIIGAYREDTVDTDAGAAYIFTSTSTPGSETVLCVNTTTSRVGVGTGSPSVELHVSGTGAIIVPSGTTAERPATGVTGMIRFNNTTYKYEGWGMSNWVDLSIADPPGLYSFTSHTFTHCGGDSRYGPQLSDAIATYGNVSPWNDTNLFNIATRGFQLWTVPQTGTYRITARGARGGQESSSAGSYNNTPGSGGAVRADIALTINTKIVFIIGQTPPQSTGNYRSGSGGGATWVFNPGAGYTNVSDVYMIAGGGGGAGPRHYNSGTAGHADASSQSVPGGGGTSHWNSNGGGAGLTSDGAPSGARGGVRPAGGAMGGTGTTHGGFGGGGSESGDSAGGGAGAKGGRAAIRYDSTGSDTARGGTSYITTNATNRSFLGIHGLSNGNVDVELLP